MKKWLREKQLELAMRLAGPTHVVRHKDDDPLKVHNDLIKWKSALQDAAIVHFAMNDDNMNDPFLMLQDVLHAADQMSLDPAISSEAEALICRGKQEAIVELIELCREDPAGFSAMLEEIKAN